MEIEKVGILTDYLDTTKYETVSKSSYRRNILYLSYLEMIEKFFVSMRVCHE